MTLFERAPERRRLARMCAAGLSAFALAGCTISGGSPAAESAPSPGARNDGSVVPQPVVSDGPDRTTPEQLSADLLAASSAEPPALGSVTAPVGVGQPQLTLDVLEVRRVDDATFVSMRVTASEPYAVGLSSFSAGRFVSDTFIRDIYLDDTAGGTRYLPLQFEDHRAACVCPNTPLTLGAEPQRLTALFPALPDDAETVDLRLGTTDLVVTGLPVD